MFTGTFNAHPQCMAAAKATLDILEKEDVYQHIFELGAQARKGLRSILSDLNIPGVVAGFGSVFVIYFGQDAVSCYADIARCDSEMSRQFRKALIKRGIFSLPVGWKRNHVCFSHTREDIEQFLVSAEHALMALKTHY